MMSLKITSSTNPRIKQIIKLRELSMRKESGLMIVDGLREISRAIEAKIKLKEVYVCPELLKVEGTALLKRMALFQKPTLETSRAVFERIAYGEKKDGLLLIAQMPRHTFSDLSLSRNPLCVVVEHVEKPGNLGAILRGADAAGADAVLISDPKTDIYNPNVIRASLGTVFTVKTVAGANEDVFRFLKAKGIHVCTARVQAKTDYLKVDFKRPTAIVVGSEEKGLSGFWVEHTDTEARIPMLGCADSLNVATSTAILLYEALRQRNA